MYELVECEIYLPDRGLAVYVMLDAAQVQQTQLAASDCNETHHSAHAYVCTRVREGLRSQHGIDEEVRWKQLVIVKPTRFASIEQPSLFSATDNPDHHLGGVMA